MAFLKDPFRKKTPSKNFLEGWASPSEVDELLLSRARLQVRLESRTSPMVYITIGAIGGVLYYIARNQMMSGAVEQKLATAFESFPI